MGRPLLSACMVVKDEEAFLPGCLESFDRLADEIIVVDTGSTDSTLEICDEWGCRIIRLDGWDFNFAAARQAGMDAAEGKWFLTVDADYVFHWRRVHPWVTSRGRAFELARAALADERGPWMLLQFVDAAGRSEWRADRLIRRDAWRWGGHVNEYPYPLDPGFDPRPATGGPFTICPGLIVQELRPWGHHNARWLDIITAAGRDGDRPPAAPYAGHGAATAAHICWARERWEEAARWLAAADAAQAAEPGTVFERWHFEQHVAPVRAAPAVRRYG